MAIGAHFKHRCNVYRAETVSDEYENKRRDFGSKPHVEGVSCLYVVKDRVRRDSETSELVAVSETMLLVGADEDIEIGDRVSDIELENETKRGPFDVVSVRLRRKARSLSHKSMILKEVR